jgi:EAL and modified HD-GYP domain-containing signal transduction protein
MHDAIFMLPKNMWFLILRSVEINDEIIHRCSFLKQKGYQLALSSVAQLNKQSRHLMPLINVIKINVNPLNQTRHHDTRTQTTAALGANTALFRQA